MKITKRQLQKIIKEEIKAVTEIRDESGYHWENIGELLDDLANLGDHITYTTPSGPVIMDGITAALNSGYELVRRDIATEGVIDPKTGLTDSDEARSKARRRANNHFAKFGGQKEKLIWQLNDQWQPIARKFKEDGVMGSDLFWQFIFNKLDEDHKEALIANTSNYDAMRKYVNPKNI